MRRIESRRARHAAARMRAGAAEIERADRRRVTRMARQRAHEEELVGPQVAVEDVALGDAEDVLEIERRVEPRGDQRRLDRRHEARDLLQELALEPLALEAPVGARQPVRQVLHEAGHHVAAARRERVVEQRGHEAVDPEFVGDASAPRLAVGVLRAREPGHERELRALQRIGRRIAAFELAAPPTARG